MSRYNEYQLKHIKNHATLRPLRNNSCEYFPPFAAVQGIAVYLWQLSPINSICSLILQGSHGVPTVWRQGWRGHAWAGMLRIMPAWAIYRAVRQSFFDTDLANIQRQVCMKKNSDFPSANKYMFLRSAFLRVEWRHTVNLRSRYLLTMTFNDCDWFCMIFDVSASFSLPFFNYVTQSQHGPINYVIN